MSEKQTQEVPEWQRKIGYATNAAGMIAGPAAITMAYQQAKRKEGGMPRATVEAAAKKRKSNKSVQRLARIMRNPKMVAAGGVTAVGLQTANWTGDTIAANALRKKPKEEDAVGKADGKAALKKIRNQVRGNVTSKFEQQKKLLDVEHKMAEDAAWMNLKHARLRRSNQMPMAATGSTPVKKSEQSLISKSDEVLGRGDGVGTNLMSKRMGPVSDEEWEKGRKKDKRAHGIAGGISGGVLGGGLGAIGGAAWHDADAQKYNNRVFDNDLERRYAQTRGRTPNYKALPKRPRAGLRVGGGAAAGALIGGGLLALGSRKAVDHAYNQPENRRNVNRLRMMVDSADDELETWSAKAKAKRLKAERKAAELEKRDRNFDAESDRQRRLGLFTGGAAGGSALLGLNAARGTRIIGATDEEGMKAKTSKPPKPAPKGSQRGLAILAPADKMKRRIASGAGSVGLAALALAAYKHGQSENNRPWN